MCFVHNVNHVILGVSLLVAKDDLPPDLDTTLGKWLLAQQRDRRKEFETLKKLDLDPDNPTLISHVRNVILPPATHKTIKLNLGARETPQSKAALSILKNKVTWGYQQKFWNRKIDLQIARTNSNSFDFDISPKPTWPF